MADIKEEGRVITLEETQELYDWLQGKAQPEGFTFQEPPSLTQKQAFAVVYYLQEKLNVIPNTYERCDKCGSLYDSDCEGTCIDGDTTVINADGEEIPGNFPKEMHGTYCDDCRPDEVPTPYDE